MEAVVSISTLNAVVHNTKNPGGRSLAGMYRIIGELHACNE